MSAKVEQKSARIIGKIVTASRKQLGKSKSAMAEHYIKQYYKNVPPDDLATRKPEQWADLALNHLKISETRKSGKDCVRVFNPQLENEGWGLGKTSLEIVTEDMPFLVDSVTAELNRQEVDVQILVHPIMTVLRTPAGKLRDVVDRRTNETDALRESFMHIEFTRLKAARLKEIKQRIEKVIQDVRYAVEDWRGMRHRMWTLIEEYETSSVPGHSTEDVAEARNFLRWIHDNHFTFLGSRDYSFKASGKTVKAVIDKKSELGILRDPTTNVFETLSDGGTTAPDVDAFLRHPGLIMVTKTNDRATVHRRVHMDAIAIKKLDAKGKVIGQQIFVGLFTSSAYNCSPREIPMLRQKIDRAVQRAGFRPASHDGKVLMNILETYPRDEMFLVSDEEFYETSIGILHLQERQRVALFVRRDGFERTMSCLVFIPRDRFNSDLRQQAGVILAGAFNGKMVAFETQFGDGPLARVHFIIKTTPGKVPAYNIPDIEKQLFEASRTWEDNLEAAMLENYSEEETHGMLLRYRHAFGHGFQDQYGAASAVVDIPRIDSVIETGVIAMDLYNKPSNRTGQNEISVRFQLFHPDRPIPLSHVLPIIEHMGFTVIEESPHKIEVVGKTPRVVMLHDFGLQAKDGGKVDCAAIYDDFTRAFNRVWYGHAESDGFNALVCQAGLNWREVSVVRAYCKYLRQVRIPYSQSYMEQTLSNNPNFAKMLVQLFQVQFDPARTKTSQREINNIRKRFMNALDTVTSADEDRILTRFLNVIDNSLRTNYYQRNADGGYKPCLSIKLDSQKLEDIPLPKPLREIFVYSPRVEGVHLRFGLVARGGLRWSDRPEDFRTEILGLVKAQQVKNAVIVPVGSKGGFVLKNIPTEGGREAFMAEGIACYQTFIAGLLDITDNIKGNKITAPKQVVRHDGDDPYLVVAADKGTATFSDIANGVSEEYGHWLGDAFASGGSQGYDHKVMGITARGAWESVKRHFREIGKNIQKEDFNVIGIGDMAGDVFGNGMLLSKHIRLQGAFNHMHIFVDPDPDPAKTWIERKRLFDLPRSSWTDFDKKILSKGAAIYERNAKSLSLTPQIKSLFGFSKDKVTPNELMTAMLMAPVDLLWFGGIGTYIKADSESHLDVGDRANDAIRVNGEDVAAKVVGEGANLGATQLGRIEYGLNGGRLNTDAIDNSAGVDCSDHEVNIKILIDANVAAGKMTVNQRNKLLASMTDEVGLLCLVDNYQQSQAITLTQSKGVGAIENQARMIRKLEKLDRLNRSVEYLPDDEMIAERIADHQGMMRPELAVLMSYAKIWLYDEILASNIPDDPATVEDLVRYFPTALQVKFRPGIEKHRLRREIIATRITNSLINRMGDTFIAELAEKTGMPVATIVRAFVIAREVYGVRGIWQEIEALDNKIDADVQTAMLVEINNLLERGTLWFMNNGAAGLEIDQHIREYGGGVAQLSKEIDGVIPVYYQNDLAKRAKVYMDSGVPKALALRISGLVNLNAGCDVVRLASARKLSVSAIARVYFVVGAQFKFGRLRYIAEGLGAEGYWQQLAADALIEESFKQQLNVVSQVIDVGSPKTTAQQDVDTWISKNAEVVNRAEILLSELWDNDVHDVAMIAVASRQLRTLCRDE
jgi:glutamate dehydrogenase